MKKTAYILVNFGGPRNLSEVGPFLKALLTDTDVIHPKLPSILHRLLFTRIAKKRTKAISHDYQSIGGKSPIFSDTESLANHLRQKGISPLLTFHRYLLETHHSFLKSVHELDAEEIVLFPLFPQFTYATTGSCARWFSNHLPNHILSKFRWIRSYPTHSAFVSVHQTLIRDFLKTHAIAEQDILFLFSAHGIPKSFVTKGDIYKEECEASFHAVMKAFPLALGKLCYQSQFGPEEWIKPYTLDVCKEIDLWRGNRTHVVFIPISFTSDHIETLFEVEEQYMSLIKAKNLSVWRVPALTLYPAWIEAIPQILNSDIGMKSNNAMLIRK